jgi:streptogramin lyase
VNSSLPHAAARSIATLATTLLALLLLAPCASAVQRTTLFNLGDGTRVVDVTAGSDGALWFSANSLSPSLHGELGRVSATGEVTHFPLSQPDERFAGVGGIAEGPEGNLWFTEPKSGRIGSVTPSGQIFEVYDGIYGTHPKQIVAVPDGNIWFTDAYAVVRYTPGTGVFTEFDLPPGADPTGIVSGPDGAIWFAERGMGHIGRITTSGQYARFEIPGISHPRQIVVGPDGNLWFTDEEAPRVGRITTGGQITLFPVPVNGGTDRLASGPGGRLWFSSGAEIGTISPRGETTAPECLPSACQLTIDGLTRGPDGEPWVATGSFLGKFVPSVRVSIGQHPSRIRGRYLTVGLWCDGGVLDRPCEGALRLNGLVPRPGPRGGGPMTLLLADSRFSIPGDSGGRVTLRLRGRPFRLLADCDRIKAWAFTTLGAEGDRPLPLTLRR